MSAHRDAVLRGVALPRDFDRPAGQALRLASHARRRDLVVIGGSAGGVPALLGIIAALPSTFDTPLAIVLHRTSKPPRLLDKLLARRTQLRVAEVAQGDTIAPHTVFLAPPDLHLLVRQDGTFGVEDGRRIEHVRSSANPLFESAADVFGAGVVAVVLSGTGRNGARGVAAVRERGGTVIAQNHSSSPYFGMPSAAIETGAVDFVVPVDEIASALVVLCTPAVRLPPISSPG